jgi:hypothetical protein
MAFSGFPSETEALAKELAAAQSPSVEDAGVLPEPQRRRDQSRAAIAARQASGNRTVAEVAAMSILAPHEVVDDLNVPRLQCPEWP